MATKVGRRRTSDHSDDELRRDVKTIFANIAATSLNLRGELVRKVVLSVTARGRSVDASDIEWSPAVLPFFQVLGAPPDGLGGSESKAFDPLAWYATAAP